MTSLFNAISMGFHLYIDVGHTDMRFHFRCELWYHWGCVGIRDNDTRLHDGKVFACPPCRGNKYVDIISELSVSSTQS